MARPGEELDLPQDRPLAEILPFHAVDEERQVAWQDQRHHPDVVGVLAGALVQAEKAMALAPKEEDRGERAKCLQVARVRFPVEEIRPEIDGLPAKQELLGAAGQKGLQERQVGVES